MKNQRKILILGPRASKNDPYQTGGTIILFEYLIKDLQKMGANIVVVDINMKNYQNIIFGLISVYSQVLINLSKVKHISLHGTVKSYLYIAPFLLVVSAITKKRISLRKFAGNFHEIYENSSRIKKIIIENVIRHADINYFETKYLVEYFKKWNKNTFWFPNVRERRMDAKVPRKFNKRFVFISHVIKSKGIDIILQASINFDERFTFDIYGPILNAEYTIEDFIGYNVKYKGPLKNEEVLNVLNKYDVLMLPSYKEGYPGIIIEAYSLGIPVISTDLDSIRELCESGKEGLLVKAGDVEQFSHAIKCIDNCNYSEMSENALKKFALFDSEFYSSKYFEMISAN